LHSITASLLAYTAAAVVLVVTPGLDTALVVRTAAREGSRQALLAGVGIITGCMVWTAVVAAGLGVLLTASRFSYTVLRWAGAWSNHRCPDTGCSSHHQRLGRSPITSLMAFTTAAGWSIWM